MFLPPKNSLLKKGEFSKSFVEEGHFILGNVIPISHI